MPSNVDDNLQASLIELDSHLMNGFHILRSLRQKYFKLKDQEGFNYDSFLQDGKNQLEEWYQAVLRSIGKSLVETHHLFHFIQHKGSSMILSNVPEQLSNLLLSFEYYLYALEDVVLRLEEKRNLAIRQEIAEKEYQADTLYKITYSTHTREIKLNNIIIAKPDFDSENDNFFQFVYSNPNRTIGLEELSEHMGGQPTKRLVQILSDLNFVGDLKSVFFPAVTKDQVMFVNPISKQYAFQHELPAINFKKIGRQSKIE